VCVQRSKWFGVWQRDVAFCLNGAPIRRGNGRARAGFDGHGSLKQRRGSRNPPKQAGSRERNCRLCTIPQRFGRPTGNQKQLDTAALSPCFLPRENSAEAGRAAMGADLGFVAPVACLPCRFSKSTAAHAKERNPPPGRQPTQATPTPVTCTSHPLYTRSPSPNHLLQWRSVCRGQPGHPGAARDLRRATRSAAANLTAHRTLIRNAQTGLSPERASKPRPG